MRDRFADALKVAIKGQDKRRMSTLRLIHAAIKDKDIAHRGAGRDPVGEEEILQILAKMVKQREESAKIFEENGRAELAEQERGEIEVIREFMPQQMPDGAMQSACRDVVAETDAKGLRDVGRCMSALKEKFPGQMDFGKASSVVKELLR